METLTKGGETVFERFKDEARRVMGLANQEALRWNHEFVGTEHLLLGLMYEPETIAGKVLVSFKLTLERVRAAVSEFLEAEEKE